ncbi:MAG: hypothetical protein C0600_07915 [Ignavibacteria bacterium]|nr:MAG: hypothetical protein C0600_07915 [Ignavibacteria bacterium]
MAHHHSNSAKNRRPFPISGKGRSVVIGSVLFVLAVLLRFLFYLKLQDTPFFLSHFSDSRLYVELASAIVSGGGIDRAYFMSPLYPYFLAGVGQLFGPPETAMRIIQMLFGGGAAVLTYRVGLKQLGETAGVVAGVAVAFYAPLIYYDGLLLIESLLTLLCIAFLLSMLSAIEKRSRGLWILSGLLLGIAAVTRANILLFIPVFLLFWMFSTDLKKHVPVANLVLFIITIGVVILPTTMHNAAKEGVFLPVTSSFGYNLYAGNNADADGFYSMPEPVDLYTDTKGRAWVERQEGREMNAAQVSDWWRDRALGWMGENPWHATTHMLRKTVLFFYPGEVDQLGLSMSFFTGQYGPITGIPQAAFPVLLILSFVGAGFAVANRKGGWVLPLFFLSYLMATALFFVNARFRLPIMPIMMIYSAYASVELVRMIRLKRLAAPASIALLISMAAAALLLLVQPKVEQDFSQEYLKLGQTAFDTGDFPAAEAAFRTSLDERHTCDGWTNLGNALAAQQRMDEAANMYRTALKEDSTFALAWFNFGNLWMQTGKPQYAFGYWKKAIEHDPLLAGAHRNLGLLLIRAGRLSEARSALNTYLELEPDATKRAEIQADLQRLKNAQPGP